MERVISLFGLLSTIGLAWLLSSHKRLFPWRLVAAGLALQFVLAFLILKTRTGLRVFQWIGNLFTALLGFVDAGSEFVFGKFSEFHFAFQVLPTIIFFSSLMSVLYHLGVMQRVVQCLAWLMQRTLRTSAAETLSASANIFMGQTEAPLVVRPYIATMTRSELNAVMVGGFATISGGVLAAFVKLQIDAGHLVTASVISSPAALVVAKILLPETERPSTLDKAQLSLPQPARNIIEAATIGASDGLKLALNVAAVLIAFIALINMCDAALGWIGAWCGQSWSLTGALGYLFAPLAWTMGIEPRDCLHAGELLGIKMVANEVQAYMQLSEWMQPSSSVTLQPRTVTILTYALCGFSNFASIGIQIGGLGALAPERQSDLAALGLRAMLGGTLACNLTACVAGALL
ncbi:MAG: NupC/NupG family nucleoside CNT transporter [Pirellulaceae bacterium]